MQHLINSPRDFSKANDAFFFIWKLCYTILIQQLEYRNEQLSFILISFEVTGGREFLLQITKLASCSMQRPKTL